jgi:hypothetical protein
MRWNDVPIIEDEAVMFRNYQLLITLLEETQDIF